MLNTIENSDVLQDEKTALRNLLNRVAEIEDEENEENECREFLEFFKRKEAERSIENR